VKKIFIDTNIWLRFLVADNEPMFKDALKLIEALESGNFRSYTSTIVLLELNYTLRTFYKLPKRSVIEDIKKLTATRNISVIEKTNFKKALEYYVKYNIKLGDCIIASQLPVNTVLCSFDEDFQKIEGVSAMSPRELLNLPL